LKNNQSLSTHSFAELVDQPPARKPRKFWSYGPAMVSEDARARGKYLDQKIRDGENFIRKTPLD
jgi:hypothetical protein